MSSSTLLQNGNYVMQNGQLLNQNSLVTEIYMSVIVPIGTFIYDATLGSTLFTYLKSGNITRTGIINLIITALGSLVQSGQIVNPQVIITNLVANRVAFSINATDNNGQPVIFNWNNYGIN